MKILLVHNYYKQRGGEDESFESEVDLLRANGHEVLVYTRHNDEIDGLSKASVSWKLMWNRESYQSLSKILKDFDADVMHCTNLFPLISVSAYSAAKKFGVPVVQSLRNYRHMCLNSFLYRDGGVCEKCKTKIIPLPGIINGCYKNSIVGSAVLAAHNAFHSVRKTATANVDLFFTPTEFARSKYVEAGWPSEQIVVKPNFLDPMPEHSFQKRNYAIYVGRLSKEKGVKTLVNTWIDNGIDLPLKMVGDGFLNGFVDGAAKEHDAICYDGRVPRSEVLSLIAGAKFLIIPSQWYETFGRTIMEAFASGTPVIASRLGAMQELVQHEHNGLLIEPGDAQDLASQVERLLQDEQLTSQLGINARKTFEQRYTAELNYQHILDVYEQAIRHHSQKFSHSGHNGYSSPNGRTTFNGDMQL